MGPRLELALLLVWCALADAAGGAASSRPRAERLAVVTGGGELWVAVPAPHRHAPARAQAPHPAKPLDLAGEGGFGEQGAVLGDVLAPIAILVLAGGTVMFFLVFGALIMLGGLEWGEHDGEEGDWTDEKCEDLKTRDVVVQPRRSFPAEQAAPPQKPPGVRDIFGQHAEQYDEAVVFAAPPAPAPPPPARQWQPKITSFAEPPASEPAEAKQPPRHDHHETTDTLDTSQDLSSVGSDSQAGRTVENLCPGLLVPAGMEFVFVMPESIEAGRQDMSFNVVDISGAPTVRVVMSERRPMGEQRPGIYLQALGGANMAMMLTEQLHTGTGKSATICWPNGEQFAVLKRDGAKGPAGRYKLRHRSGQKLVSFHGDFVEKAINVVNHSGKLVCATERKAVDFDRGQNYYQVRVAPHVDAGIVICSLLLIDKLEKKSELERQKELGR